MTIEAKECVLADFQVVVLGVDFPSYFQGFGCSFTEFDHCTYGIGYTEAEALDDCIEMMCQSAGVDITEEDVQRIRAEYGDCDSETTVDDILGRNDCDRATKTPMMTIATAGGVMTIVANLAIFTSVSGGTKN